MKKINMSLIVKEITYVKYIYVAVVLVIYSIIMLICVTDGNIMSMNTMYDFTESVLVICLSIMCSEIIFNESDLNIIFSSVKSKFKYIFTKYLIHLFVILIVFFILSIIQYLLYRISMDAIDTNKYISITRMWFDLILTFIFSSTFIVAISIIIKSKTVAYASSLFLPLMQIETAVVLYKYHITDYRWLFTSFNTLYIESRIWYINKIFYGLISIIIWILIFYILKYSKKDIVANDE